MTHDEATKTGLIGGDAIEISNANDSDPNNTTHTLKSVSIWGGGADDDHVQGDPGSVGNVLLGGAGEDRGSLGHVGLLALT